MARDSTASIESLGAIRQIVKQFGKITSALGKQGQHSQDISAAVLKNTGVRKDFISGEKFDLIKGIFRQHTKNDNLATAYALLTLDAMKKFNTNYDQLFDQADDGNELRFSDLGVALLNNYRPSTSQIGIKIPQNTNPYVLRNIIV